MKLIREILAQIEAAKVDGAGDKLGDIDKNEKVLGVLPEELQRFFVVMDDMNKKELEKLLALKEDFLAAKSAPESKDCQCPGCNGTLDAVRNRSETIKNMFWGAVRRAIPAALKADRIGVRKGFQVVVITSEEPRVELIAMKIPLPAELLEILRQQ